MPITPSLLLRPVSDDQFAIIDEAVMRCAYAVQTMLTSRRRNDGLGDLIHLIVSSDLFNTK